MIISAIIKRLRLKLPFLKYGNRIAGGVELALNPDGKKTRLELPCIYVFHDRTSTERLGVDMVTQKNMTITEYFVLRAIFENTDRRGQFSQDQAFALRFDILSAFLGWIPTLDEGTEIDQISSVGGMELFEDKMSGLTEETYSHDYTINFSYDVHQQFQGIGAVMPDSALEDLLRIRGDIEPEGITDQPARSFQIDY